MGVSVGVIKVKRYPWGSERVRRTGMTLAGAEGNSVHCNHAHTLKKKNAHFHSLSRTLPTRLLSHTLLMAHGISTNHSSCTNTPAKAISMYIIIIFYITPTKCLKCHFANALQMGTRPATESKLVHELKKEPKQNKTKQKNRNKELQLIMSSKHK